MGKLINRFILWCKGGDGSDTTTYGGEFDLSETDYNGY